MSAHRLDRVLQKKLNFYKFPYTVWEIVEMMQEEQTYSKVDLWQFFSCGILWDRNLEMLLLKKGTHRKCRPVRRRIYTTKESNTLTLRLHFEIQSLLKSNVQKPVCKTRQPFNFFSK